MWSITGAKRAIIVASCLAAAYTQLTTSPATIRYARSIGANELHIGILSALPTLMLFMQFISGVVVNHLRYRRRLWFWSAMIHRLLLLPTAIGPFLIKDMPPEFWVTTLLITTALNQALLHFSSPLWLSWMGDYLPHEGLSHYWGSRQFWSQITAAGSLAAAAFLVLKSDLGIESGYAVLTCIGTLCGVIDLTLFHRIVEPPVTRMPSPRLRQVLAAPFRNKDFRRYIRFMCYWNFAAMAGAPFISLYLLEECQMDLFRVLLLWTISWIGGAMFSRTLGRWADVYGTRPVLVVCVATKSANMLALLLTPHNPDIAFWVLAPFFMLDAAQNAGILIANNGFMIKHSPTENRTMYIAATQALAGIVGGLTSIAAGGIMTMLAGQTWVIGGWSMGHFQMMFASSILLRWLALLLVGTVREPNSHATMTLVVDVVESFSWRAMFPAAGLSQNSDESVPPVEEAATESDAVPSPKFARSRKPRRAVAKPH
ncbi:MAG TPA: MFS transporter [Schlesneria sp.]